MKDVILDMEAIKRPYTGLGRFSLNLSQALLKQNEDLTFGFYGSNLEMHKGMYYRGQSPASDFSPRDSPNLKFGMPCTRNSYIFPNIQTSC